jgi:hypothetical protein
MTTFLPITALALGLVVGLSPGSASLAQGRSGSTPGAVIDTSPSGGSQAPIDRSSLASEMYKLRALAPASSPTWRSLNEMHDYIVGTFVATPGFGSERMGGMMLQLDPNQRLELSGEQALTDDAGGGAPEAWTIKTLELIGVARHEQPVVFSRVAHGIVGSTRSVNDVEQKALTRLRSGSNIVIGQASEAHASLVFGAIRAQTGCIRCHQAQLGDLLGAFRYVMQEAPRETSR